jgi:cyclopropane-fatty-acyl-phospholipid synthase
VHAEDFAPHYAETLRRWRHAFNQQLDAVRAQGFDDYFIRLWNYYLCYCEAAFTERVIGVLQIQFDKPACRRDPLQISECASRRTDRTHHRPHVAIAKQTVKYEAVGNRD